jgi:hypothetical protein
MNTEQHTKTIHTRHDVTLHKFEPGFMSWYFLICVVLACTIFLVGTFFGLKGIGTTYKSIFSDSSVAIDCNKNTDICYCKVNGLHPSLVQLQYCEVVMKDMMNITWNEPTYKFTTPAQEP